MIKKCLHCGKEILVQEWNKDKKFCSRKCQYAQREKEAYVNVKCNYCGKALRKRKKYLEKHDNSFCDRKCSIEYIKAKTVYKKCICKTCGKEFTYKESNRGKGKEAAYCSRKCWRISEVKLKSGNCYYCHKPMKQKSSPSRPNKMVCCSRECWIAFKYQMTFSATERYCPKCKQWKHIKYFYITRACKTKGISWSSYCGDCEKYRNYKLSHKEYAVVLKALLSLQKTINETEEQKHG